MDIDITGEKSNGSQDYQRWRDEARQAQAQLAQERADRINAESVAIDTVLGQAERDAELAVERQARYWENGDYQDAARASREVAEAEQRIARYKEGKAALEAQRQTMPAGDPVEAYIGQFSPAKQDMLRRHRAEIFDKGNGAAMTHRPTAAHYDAISEGLQEDSPEYFRRLEGELSSSASYNTGGSMKIKLTKDEVEFCRDAGIDMKGYAEEKARIARGESNVQFTSQKYGNFNPSGSIVGR